MLHEQYAIDRQYGALLGRTTDDRRFLSLQDARWQPAAATNSTTMTFGVVFQRDATI